MKFLAIVPSLLAATLLSLTALAAGCGASSRGPAPADPSADRAASSAPPSGASTAPAARSPQPSSARAANPPPPAAELARADAAVERLLGGWVGAGESPFGEMPFAALFERLPDGGARAWADDGKGSAISVRLQRAPGGWRLREQASLPGVGTQAHTLHLVAAEAADARARLLFTHPERPGFLDLELSVEGEELVLAARLRGQPHVRFTMKRLPEAALPTLASRLHAPGTAPPADDASLPPAAY